MKAIRILPLALVFFLPGAAVAHCDTLRGPVVAAARAALAASDASPVLHWVRAEDEEAVRSALRHVLAVRGLGPEAAELADRYFFETVVRLHRQGEGAPFTGLKDADPEEVVAAVDRALATGERAKLERLLVDAVRVHLDRNLAPALAGRSFRPGDVAAGREFVAAYVRLTHWAEGVLSAAEGGHEAPTNSREPAHAH
jgi:hypothetical protein